MKLLKAELEGAMLNATPHLAFRQNVTDRLNAGIAHEALMEELQAIRAQVDSEGEDVILEVLDFLAGWCHPDMRI